MKTIDKKVLLNRKSCCGAKPHCTNCPYFPRGSMGSTKIYCHRCGTVVVYPYEQQNKALDFFLMYNLQHLCL